MTDVLILVGPPAAVWIWIFTLTHPHNPRAGIIPTAVVFVVCLYAYVKVAARERRKRRGS